MAPGRGRACFVRRDRDQDMGRGGEDALDVGERRIGIEVQARNAIALVCRFRRGADGSGGREASRAPTPRERTGGETEAQSEQHGEILPWRWPRSCMRGRATLAGRARRVNAKTAKNAMRQGASP